MLEITDQELQNCISKLLGFYVSVVIDKKIKVICVIFGFQLFIAAAVRNMYFSNSPLFQRCGFPSQGIPVMLHNCSICKAFAHFVKPF